MPPAPERFSIARAVLSTLGGVAVSISVIVALLFIAAVGEAPEDGSDSYVRGIIGVAIMLPTLAGMLVAFHALAIITARAVGRPIVVFGSSCGIVSVGLAVFIGLFPDVPFVEAMVFGAIILLILAAGTVVPYLVCFRGVTRLAA